MKVYKYYSIPWWSSEATRLLVAKVAIFLVGYNRVWWYQGVISVLRVALSPSRGQCECTTAVFWCPRDPRAWYETKVVCCGGFTGWDATSVSELEVIAVRVVVVVTWWCGRSEGAERHHGFVSGGRRAGSRVSFAAQPRHGGQRHTHLLVSPITL